MLNLSSNFQSIRHGDASSYSRQSLMMAWLLQLGMFVTSFYVKSSLQNLNQKPDRKQKSRLKYNAQL